MTGRERRIVIVGVAVALGAWCGLQGIPRVWHYWRGMADRLVAQRELLHETRLALEGLPGLEDSARVLRERISALAPQILSGSSDVVALSDLSGRMRTLAGLCHGRLFKFEPAADSARAGLLRRVSARIGVETDFLGLAEFLERLRRGALVTVVEDLQVAPADAASPGSTAERLTVDLRVSAWYLAREAGA